MKLNKPSRLILPALTLSTLFPLAAQAGTIANGTLYYTTFAGGTNVHKVDYSYDGGTNFSLTNNTGIASTAGADGLLFAPDGNLLVAGQNINQLHEITPSGTAVTTVAAGTGSYHLALSSNASNAILYNLWNGPGGGGSTSISATTLSGGGLATNAMAYTVTCDSGSGCDTTDVRGLIYNPSDNSWYYGTAPDGGTGQFGTVTLDDTNHTAVLHTLVTSGIYAHGLTWDSYLGHIIASSANTIQELDNSGNVIGTLTGNPGDQFDQTAVDGHGHLFAASNNGDLAFWDYSNQANIGLSSFSDIRFLAANLDDIAPLSGVGAQTVAEPASTTLFGIGLAAAGFFRRRKLA